MRAIGIVVPAPVNTQTGRLDEAVARATGWLLCLAAGDAARTGPARARHLRGRTPARGPKAA